MRAERPSTTVWITTSKKAMLATSLAVLLASTGCDDDTPPKNPPDAAADAGADGPPADGAPDAPPPDAGADAPMDDASGDATGPVGDGGGDAGDDGGDAGDDAGMAKKVLDPLTIPKYVDPLVIPPVMPPTATQQGLTEYAIAVRQFEQQVLPTGMPSTTVFGYGKAGDPLPGGGQPTTFNFPAFTVEARSNEKVRVRWINGLMDDSGAYLPHLLPVDQTLHWANPEGPIDKKGTASTPYTGPVPIVTHVHGAHVAAVSDGYPEAWYLPAANDLPAGYATKGTHYGTAQPAASGEAIFEYDNDQRAATLWYHDHSLGITRLNVYAGMAGFWILRDDVEDAIDLPGPAPKLGDAPGTKYYEIPVVIQDRSFHEDGSWFYPASRTHFDGYQGPYTPASKVSPIWNPEFFGDAMVVNGKTWPYLEVEPRLYRFRIINGCNSRFLRLKLDQVGLDFHQIGSEGGLLPDKPEKLTELLMGPAERADVIIDFSSLAEGQEVVLLNLGPDEPFKGPGKQQLPANPQTTGQVMKFKVVQPTNQGNPGSIPATLPPVTPLTTTLPPRDVTVNEEVDEAADVPVAALLGTAADGPLTWGDPTTETIKLGSTEIWRVINLTEDAHPIHLHLVMFQVLDRTRFDAEAYADAQEDFISKGGTQPQIADYFTAAATPPAPWERGWKDTVIANPGEVTRFIATFDLPGLYAWHCHILEHEDNEMMRPFTVAP